ncbi:MAG: hypothetical protein RLZZ623_3068 [Actinomycetota bacterium]
MRKNRHDEVTMPFMEEAPIDFLPDEAEQDSRLAGVNLRERMAKLEAQMMAQYTAMAAYASIAQRNSDMVQAESRSDLDRSQSTMIGLIERVRRECADSIEGAMRRTGGGVESDGARLASLEKKFDGLTTALERSIEAQQLLAEQVTLLLEDKMHRDGWLVANGNATDLSLH